MRHDVEEICGILSGLIGIQDKPGCCLETNREMLHWIISYAREVVELSVV